MASGVTAKYALPYPEPQDTPNIPGDVQSLANLLDGLIATAAQGTAASRPAAGKSGRSYYATDTGALSLDTGSAWVTVGIVNTSAGTIAPVTPGAAAAAGGSGQAADAAHVHSAPAFSGTGDITASAPGQAVAAGASGRFADGAHQHAREAWGLAADITPGTPGQAAAVGTSGRVADASHKHAIPAFGAAGNIAPLSFGGSASAGATGLFADAGHVHAMPASPAASPLATHVYAPTSNTKLNAGINNTWLAFDTTNASLLITAPSSGRVLYRVTGTAGNGSSSNDYLLLGCAPHGKTTPLFTTSTVGYASNDYGFSVVIIATGLTSGTNYTFDLIGRNGYSSDSSQLTLNVGNGTPAATYAPLTIEAWAG